MDSQPLRRNRDFMLLQSGQLLSSAGTASTGIAYSLLVLDVTHSAAKTGVVAFARLMPMALLALPAGLVADRWNRRRLMIASDVVRAIAVGALALAIALDTVPFWTIVLVAVVEGIGTAFFASAQTGALRSVVPTTQMPAAIAAQTGRRAAVMVAGRRSAERCSRPPGRCRSSATRSPTRSRPGRCSRCGHRSRRSASRIRTRCAPG